MKCRELTQLYEQSKFEGLSFSKKVLMKLHLFYCNKCKNYLKDSDLLDELLKSNQYTLLTETEKEAILKNLGE